MRVIAREHATTRATGSMRVKNSFRCDETYFLGHWNEENERKNKTRSNS